MVLFLLIRHAESVDNIENLWAGRRDKTLTNYGMQQAKALGLYLKKKFRLHAIHTSDLMRTQLTADAIRDAQPLDVRIQQSDLLRERSFGAGEGMKIGTMDFNKSLSAHFGQGIFPPIYDRVQTFPGGECLEDVARRAEQAIDDLLLPYIREEQERQNDIVVAVVSHGVFLSELLRALLKRHPDATKSEWNSKELRKMKNTGLTQVEVCISGKQPEDATSTALRVKIIKLNQVEHLENVKRQRGLGSLPYDQKQKDIRNFFPGKVARTKEPLKPKNPY